MIFYFPLIENVRRIFLLSFSLFSGLQAITSGDYYFYLPSLSSSIHSYCENHQQTSSSYSSNGFSILYSSSSLHLPAIDIEDKKYSSFFDPNVLLSTLDQSTITTTTRNPIKLMSSTNENQTFVTKIKNSSISTLPTMTTITNRENGTMNFTLLIYCSIAGIILFIFIYLIVKLCKRDEGTYKIDESKNFPSKSPDEQLEKLGCTGKIVSSSHHRQKILANHEQKLDNSKEWYV